MRRWGISNRQHCPSKWNPLIGRSYRLSTVILLIMTNVVFSPFYWSIKSLILRVQLVLNPFNLEFTIVIFIHYKPRIAAAILDLQWMKMTWCGLKIKENYHVLVNHFHWNFRSKTLSCRKIKSVFKDVKWCFNASWGLKGVNIKICKCSVSN